MVALFVLHLRFEMNIMKKLIYTIIATIFFTLSIQAQSNSVESLINEGIKLHDSTEYKLAIEKFEGALKLNPQSTLAFYELSLSYLELKDYENASKYSTKVINANDQYLLIGAYAVKSEALVGLDRIDDAISILQDGLEKIGESYLLHFNLALNYYKINNLNKTLEHVNRAIELDKTYSGAFLLSAYAQRDKGLWIRSIYSFQMFLLLEPDSARARNAFEEMLQVMYIAPVSAEKPLQRSFIQMQMNKNKGEELASMPIEPYPADEMGDRLSIHKEITHTLDSLKEDNSGELDLFIAFKEVNKTILEGLINKGSTEVSPDNFWSFKYPFFKSILNSEYYDVFCRYISVSYFPESLKWWEENQEQAKKFIDWFEKG